MVLIYDLIFFILLIAYLPHLFLTKKYHREIWQRLGFYPVDILKKLAMPGKTIWLHAVSVGEVAAIRPFWEGLRREFPSKKIIVSTVTKTGNELAGKFASPEDIVLYVPLDFSFAINAAVRRFKPSALVIAETEIWPNLITRCRKSGIPVLLINGRISDRAFRRYRYFKFLLKGILGRINIFCVRTQEDRSRFINLGAPAERVTVSGNLKFCGNNTAKESLQAADIKNSMGIKAGELVFVAGSTHEGEEKTVLSAYKSLLGDFPNLRLIIAPRHIERAPRIKAFIGGGNSVTVIDKIGMLRDLYSIADMVFVGGSLVRHGGQNIIEPAVFAKPILFGPHMFNFKDEAKEFLKGGAAVMVHNEAELRDSCKKLLSDPGQRAALGKRAREIVLNNQGALEKCMKASGGILKKGG